jgi:DNA repair exonuclease SbcCD ATPase subunit
MSDLTERLRELSRAEHDDLSVAAEAADEIEVLRRDIVELNNTLKQYKRVLKKMAEWDAVEKEQRNLEIECEERRFNDLSDDYAALSKKTDKYRAIIQELNECSAYWSDWEIPIGLRDRLEEALKDDA